MLSLNSVSPPTSVLCLVLLFSSGALCQSRGGPQEAGREPALTVEEVVKLTHSGFTEDILITKIKKNAKAFDLNAEELLDLKKEGVSDEIVKYLLDPSLPYTPPSPVVVAKTVETPKNYPADPYASQVPGESGLYLFLGTAPLKVDLKFLLGTEQAKTRMKKGKTVGYLIGRSSKIRVRNPAQTFYVRLPDGKEIEELLLVSLSDKNGCRELALGSGGPKQELNAEDILPKEAVEVGPHLFRLNHQKLAPGEYLFLFIGSADPAKGVFGKGYDFGIDSTEEKKPSPKRGAI